MILNIEQLKKKIIYRSNYRGTKEMDKLLGAFTKKYLDQKLKIIKFSEIKSKVNLFENIKKDKNFFKVEQFDNNLFKISRSNSN